MAQAHCWGVEGRLHGVGAAVGAGTHGPVSLQPEYIALELLSQDYGFELLGMCRNQSEVTAVLNDWGEDDETEPEADGLGQAFEEGIPNLARLRLAVNYNQKRVSWALPQPSPPPPSLPCCGWAAPGTAQISSLLAFLDHDPKHPSI